MVDMQSLTGGYLEHHFATGYAPHHATMVVVGDVNSEEIFALARKYIEPIAAHAPPPKVTTVEPEQPGERRLVLNKFAQLPAIMIGYHVPESAHAGYYALQVLRTILFPGESRRVSQRIVV